MDVGVITLNKTNKKGHGICKQLEIDFVCNKGSKCYYIQSAYGIPDRAKMEQEPYVKKHPYKNKRRLHLTPLLLGIYEAHLGLSLAVVGLGMTGFGLFGIWDRIRNLLKPETAYAEEGCLFCQYMVGNTYYFLDVIEIEDRKESEFESPEAWNNWLRQQMEHFPVGWGWQAEITAITTGREKVI